MHILVVEDDDSLRETYGELLREDGQMPTLTATPREALDAFRAQKPDVVLLDWMLAGMSASGLLEAWAPYLTGVRVVICTAVHDPIDPAKLHGVKVRVLQKPFDYADLPRALGYAEP